MWPAILKQLILYVAQSWLAVLLKDWQEKRALKKKELTDKKINNVEKNIEMEGNEIDKGKLLDDISDIDSNL